MGVLSEPGKSPLFSGGTKIVPLISVKHSTATETNVEMASGILLDAYVWFGLDDVIQALKDV